jgi:hypothetical protein
VNIVHALRAVGVGDGEGCVSSVVSPSSGKCSFYSCFHTATTQLFDTDFSPKTFIPWEVIEMNVKLCLALGYSFLLTYVDCNCVNLTYSNYRVYTYVHVWLEGSSKEAKTHLRHIEEHLIQTQANIFLN